MSQNHNLRVLYCIGNRLVLNLSSTPSKIGSKIKFDVEMMRNLNLFYHNQLLPSKEVFFRYEMLIDNRCRKTNTLQINGWKMVKMQIYQQKDPNKEM